jgi:hypothetical protein
MHNKGNKRFHNSIKETFKKKGEIKKKKERPAVSA